jgi:L-ribulose-5-phosphate 4-epimerase
MSVFPEDLRLSTYRANLALVEGGLVIGTWGNASGFDPDSGLVAIKPSGVPYADLTPEQLVVVDLDGRTIAGDLRPSSDLATHLELYRRFPGVRGVAHTHSTVATAYAQACRALPCFGTTHADHFYGTVPVTRDMTPDEIAADYELNTGRVIVETFADLQPLQIPAVLVAHHGPFTWGETPTAAAKNSVVLEAVAQMALHTCALAPDTPPVPGPLLDKHFLRKHGPGAYYGQGRAE